MKLKSISRVFRNGILISQVFLLVLGITLAFYVGPKMIERSESTQLRSTTEQTRWAIAKSISYADYSVAEEYFKRLVLSSNISSALLVDENGRCIAFSAGKQTGCQFHDNKLSQQLPHRDFIRSQAVFFYPVTNGPKRVQATLHLLADRSEFVARQRSMVLITTFVFALLLLLSTLVNFRAFRVFEQEILSLRERVKGIWRGNENHAAELKFQESAEVERAIGAAGEELQKLNRELVKKERKAAVGEIASQAAHDIRSPLAALSVVVSRRDSLPADVAKLVQSAVSRIQTIAADLKSKGASAPHWEPSNLSEILRNLSKEKKLEHEQKKDVTFLSKGLDKDVWILGNPQALTRAFSNLVNNAVESMPEGGETSVSLSRQTGHIEVSIKDQGIGMGPEVLERATEKGFSQNKKEGTGLGLYYAKSVITECRGKMRISSKPGSGTEVKISFPALRN